ncbi:branched-chain amino acid ABC transporter permease [Bacillus alveayuensis]|uniref:Branched-chain amino acid transport system permease protein n=1 Tax=Aeribacillus alveayuensis TaxID=279215 RepID=A0ABT9VSF6_9BACI|nr:branched-chain amino acid ABC transporter permease [Bacillus alveayuensis]MDQ0163921.1 branched-chain amino acid transport system permease protein [Bacillus alveayuensis]
MRLEGVQQTKWTGVLIFAILVFLFPLVVTQSFYLTQATFAGIYAIVAIGLGLLMGYAGQISLGQAAFYGIGAYTTAVLTTTFGWSPWLSLLCSILFPAIVAFIMGYTMARLSGYYLAMATLALGIIVHTLLVEWRDVTKGASGLYGVPQIHLFGVTFTQGISYYYFVWTFTIIVLIISLNIVHSRVGRALRSIHDSEIASSSMGVNTGKYKMQIFILSSMFAGLAGWLFAHMSYSISPSSFTLNTSIIFLTMIVLGGSGSVWGAIFGTILIKIVGIIIHILSEQFPIITSDFEHVIYGLILMLVIIFLPRGLFPAAVDWIQSLQLKKWEKKVQQKEVYPD